MPTSCHGHVIYIGNLGRVFSQDNTPEGHTEIHNSYLFPYEQVSGRNGNHELLRMTNAFMLCDLLRKVQKSHAPNREGIFKVVRLMWEFDCLHYAQYKPMSPHDIGCK